MIDRYIQRHERFLEHILRDIVIPATPIRSAIHYSLFPGGKRLRPVLVYLAGELVQINPDILDGIAAALELIHCYSLMHDDLPAMDNDDLRRGKPSCHKAYDEATAILAGDGMQALAIELLLTQLTPLLPAPQVIKIAQILLHACGVSGMVSGQSLDLSELAKSSVSENALREIHLLKTGCLIMACFEMVIAAQTSTNKAAVEAFKTYGLHMGLVFQMQDDYLDLYAPANLLGKGRSSDLANQKTTFANLLTRQQLEDEIAVHYQTAIDSLSAFGSKADTLISLTRELKNRSVLS